MKPISNLCGHTIHLYSIHGDKSVPLVATDDMTKMEENDYFAIETFGSTGRGYVDQYVSSSSGSGNAEMLIAIQGECSNYAKVKNAPNKPLK